MSWYNLDFVFDLAVVILNYNILSGPYHGKSKVLEVDT